jgi:anti-sigma B factor antagonist
MELKLRTTAQGGIVMVHCSGRIVFGEEALLLRDTVKKALGKNKDIVLDLGEVNYIDSGGLGTLVGLYTSAHQGGGTIKLANLTRRVSDLLQITKLLTVFEVYQTEAEALESFRQAV